MLRGGRKVREVYDSYHAAALTTGVKGQYVVAYPSRISGVVAYAAVAGSGSGQTILDVKRNGQSIFATASDRPRLNATATGRFQVGALRQVALREGDVITWEVASVSTTGHSQVSVAVVLTEV